MKYGACPIIVPRVENMSKMMDSFEPIHGVVLAEGEDISEEYRPNSIEPDVDVLSAIAKAHPSDTTTDLEKDRIEFELVRRCLRRGIPYLGICRGSQILNVLAGGTIYQDIEMEVEGACRHIDYEDYDGYRHVISVGKGTPLAEWFGGRERLMVNSYHHQGVKKLGHGLVGMAWSDDGLLEGFYDPGFNPDEGRYLVGLQFHPERMQNTALALKGEKDTFDYAGCPRPYEDLVTAARAFQNKGLSPEKTILNVEKKRKSNWRGYSKEDWNRLMFSGATVHGNRLVYELLKEEEEKENDSDSDWNLCCAGIRQAGNYLEKLRGTGRREEALALMRKLWL